MRPHRPIRWFAPSLVVTLALLAGCSSEDSASGGSTTTEVEQVSFDPHVPEDVAPPPAEGQGIVLPQPAAAVPDGYVLEEYLVGGTATSFDTSDTPNDGQWTATPADDAEYRTRVVVRRPADAASFSGTVLVEWFNVSAIEAAPDWGYISEEIAREGHAYVGVSAQAQGVEGGETLLDVEVDEAAAAEEGVDTDKSGLRNADPERYGTLTHPGDAYSFDIFSQVGRLAQERPDALLGDLAPEQVIAVGESQSAMFMTTLINAVHPLAPVFDGFLVHSRGSSVPPVDGDYVSSRQTDAEATEERPAVRIRTDLEVPVMVFEAETDLTLLGYADARQPDTDLLRTWEVAGTAHADAQTLRAVLGGPRDPGIGSILGCGSINAGPHKEVLQAAVHHLVDWVAGGPPPPEGARLELQDGDEPAIARDEHGNAHGGVRNPLVDAPVAALSGDPAEGTSIEDLAGDICVLFGTTTPFDQSTLVELYGTADQYVERFRTAADEAVASGHLLQPDADVLLAEAEANRSLFP